MKPLTREWAKKAEEDFVAATRLSRSRRTPVWNIVCFHCQQCVEKYLKACLQEQGIEIPGTHNLATVLDLLLPKEPLWESTRGAFSLLSGFAVEFRYPGETATSADARRALTICRKMRSIVLERLGADRLPERRKRPVVP